LQCFADVLECARNRPPMPERINYISDTQNSLDRLPKPQNRIVNSVRFLIALAVLSPCSCVGVGAAGSRAYKKVNNIPAAENKNNDLSANLDGAKNNGDEIAEWIKKYLPSAGQNK
jgi:hypothetical protein